MNIPTSIHKMSNCDHEFVMVEPERYFCIECYRDQNTPKPCIRCYGLNVIITQGVSGCTRCDFKSNCVDSDGRNAYQRITKAIRKGTADLSDPLVKRIADIEELNTLKANLRTKLREERENQALLFDLNAS